MRYALALLMIAATCHAKDKPKREITPERTVTRRWSVFRSSDFPGYKDSKAHVVVVCSASEWAAGNGPGSTQARIRAKLAAWYNGTETLTKEAATALEETAPGEIAIVAVNDYWKALRKAGIQKPQIEE